jgi:putative transposase
MENALRANSLNIKEQYERQLKDLQEAYGEAIWRFVPKKAASPVGRGRDMILRLQQGLAVDGFGVPLAKLCRWFEVPRRTVYYRSVNAPPKAIPNMPSRSRP